MARPWAVPPYGTLETYLLIMMIQPPTAPVGSCGIRSYAATAVAAVGCPVAGANAALPHSNLLAHHLSSDNDKGVVRTSCANGQL